jgi:hypothetical protein
MYFFYKKLEAKKVKMEQFTHLAIWHSVSFKVKTHYFNCFIYNRKEAER